MRLFSYRILLFTLAFAPLAFGTVEHWSMMTVELAAALALVLCLFGLKVQGERFLKVPGLLPLVLVLGLMVLQLVPLPVWLVQAVSPQAWEAYRPGYELAGGEGWLPLSVNQNATLQELLRIGSYGLFYILTIQVLRDGQRLKQCLLFLALLGSAIAFFAILQQFSAEGKIYWFRPAPGGHPGGPWVNINQYAAFIEALAPLVLALFLFYRPSHEESSWRQRVVEFFSSPRANRHLFLGFGFVLLVFSVFVSLCRGGIITIMAAMILFAVLAGYKRRNFGRTTFWVALCLVLMAVSWFGWQPIISEFDATFDSSGVIREGRFTVWGDTLNIIRDYLFLGAGFGTYNDVYPAYKTIATNSIFEHAHNDYLELLTDGGLIGFGLAGWFVLAVLSHGWKMVRRRRDRFAVLVGVGAITSICALLMHSVVDFNLHNGAVGLYFFFICGLLVAAVNAKFAHYRAETLMPTLDGRAGSALLAGGSCFLVVAAAVQFGVLGAGYSYAQIRTIYISSHLGPEKVAEVGQALERAKLLDPLEGLYPFYRGNLAVIKESRPAALVHYLEAARLQPLQGIYLQRVALMLPLERKDQAAELMAEGYRRAVNKERLVFSWAEWLLMVERREEAIELLAARFEVDPAQVVRMAPVLETRGFSRAEMEAVLPEQVSPWVRYGEYLEQRGRIEESLYYRRRALDFVENEEEIQPGWFNQMISFYRRHDQPDLALAVVRRGIEAVPDYAPFHVQLGDYYRRQNITYRAKEEYERAVFLDPENDSYRRRLRQLELDIEFGK